MRRQLRVRKRNGYAQFFDEREGHWILTHRRAVENMLGGPLSHAHHVHHIDGDKLNNRPRNLVAVAPAVHQRLHQGDTNVCFTCGRGGHWAADCYARRDFTGRRIRSPYSRR